MSKIESRPASATGDKFAAAYHWDYVFYMDLELQARHGGVVSFIIFNTNILVFDTRFIF